MPFAPCSPALRHRAPPAHELRPARPPAPLVPVPESARIPLAAASDPDATRAWIAHVDAGRIGTPAPPPAPSATGDFRFASLVRILGLPA